jgi:high-affinity nickel permease
MENKILIFIHLLAVAVSVGSSAYCLYLFLPAMADPRSNKAPDENSLHYKALDILAPTVFTCLLVLIASGIFYLMENYTDQVNLKPGYYNLFGIKMVSAIIAFFLSAWQTFGLRSRIANLDLRPENRELVPEVLGKMSHLGKLVFGFLVVTLFLGVWLARF